MNVHIYRQLQASFESAADEDEISDEDDEDEMSDEDDEYEMSDEDVEYYAEQDAVEWRHREEGTGAYAYDPNAELRAAEELRAAAKKLGIADDVALGIMTTDTVKFAVAPAEAIKTYEIGDVGPAGGRIFSILRSFDRTHYYEAAPEDIGKHTWANAMTATQNYQHNGFSDWYLPSIEELAEMYVARNYVGGFTSNVHWSSSQADVNNAWYKNFYNGSQNFTSNNFKSKWHEYYVRPVRAFSI